MPVSIFPPSRLSPPARVRRRKALTLLGLLLACGWQPLAGAAAQAARTLVTSPVDPSQRVRLPGNTRPEVATARDLGRVDDTLVLDHLQLLLKRPAERQAALERRIQDLHDPRSADFHRWLTIDQVGRDYGPAHADVDAVLAWLRGAGFTVNTLFPGQVTIDFSGTAAEVRSAFHTEIHRLRVGADSHIANVSDPEIPAALTGVVHGVVSLSDFRPHPAFRPRPAYTVSQSGGQYELVVPADLATIYNFTPLFAAGINGQGQTIHLIEDIDVYSAADWTKFRSTFGLAGYTSGSLAAAHPAPPSGPSNCTDPGSSANFNVAEAELDAEWASAAAPGAAIVVASCRDTTTFGGFLALQNLVSSATPPAIVSISYGECEALNGATANAAWSALYQQAVLVGTSIFVAAGDDGAASCDAADKVTTAATHGIGVNAFASTPYNVAVGGTDFGDLFANAVSTYWAGTGANSATFGSALSYVPEIPWNDSCASTLLAATLGTPTTYGSAGFCNGSIAAANGYLTIGAGGGGPSGCATGAAAVSGVVGNTCAGYAKPAWQSGVIGIPADGVRDLPDVSLFSALGVWGHYYVYCNSDTATGQGGAVCGSSITSWSGGGGTSFAAPILAGVQALVNQKNGTRQGNPNAVYYPLAAVEYGASGTSVCNSTLGNATSAGCVFYDVTEGDIDVDCTGSNNCYRPSGTYGVLSTSTTGAASAYAAGSGWDFATGLGTLNVANLVNGWSASALSLTGGGSVTASGQLAYSWTISNAGPKAASGVTLTATLPAGFALASGSSSAGCSQAGTLVTCTVGTLAIGARTALSVAIQPSGSASGVSLVFTVGAANGELFPANGSVTSTLTLPVAATGLSDGPLPSWSYLALAVALVGVACRRRGTGFNIR